MIGKLVRGLSRLAYRSAKVGLIPIEAVDPRLYMRIYTALLKASGVRFTGEPRYISSRAQFDEFSKVSIGARVVISKHVILLTHDYSLTTALVALGEAPETDLSVNRPIAIGDNVFVGMGAILLPGTTIGDNVIVGAGAVVRGTLQGDSIYAGNPCRRICSISERADEWRARRSGQGIASDHS